MSDGFRLAKLLVEPLVRRMLTERKQQAQRSQPLVDLINATLLDDYQRRRLHREIEAMRDAVGQRLDSFHDAEWRGLESQDRNVAMSTVVDAFVESDLSDSMFFAIDADPKNLARYIRKQRPSAAAEAGLGEAGSRFYDRLIDECCLIYTQLAVHMAQFTPRGIVELLSRTSSLSSSIEQLLQRIPVSTLDAPSGSDHDAEFLRRYLDHISRTLDTVELFGVNVRTYQPSTPLSVAYISLAVSPDVTPNQQARQDHTPPWERLSLLENDTRGFSSMQVEHALSGAARFLLRGEAGSGKTTLLRWLAVNTARRAFGTDLADCNERVPFFIKLRSYAGRHLPAPEEFLNGVADPLSALMPRGWVHRQLEAGRALLLIDGVDELAAEDRRPVRDWIRQLIRVESDNRLVITARPHAAAARWLAAEDFTSAMLQRMGATDLRKLIAHWHRAIRGVPDLPCAPEEISGYERALLAQLDSSPHLQALVTNPLLCAMLCAINLDRHSTLPPDRMGLYAAAMDMLLERRDVERRIPDDGAPRLSARDKTYLLQYLAWRLSINGRSELSREEATVRIGDRLGNMPLLTSDSSLVLNHLLQRSGVIREPAEGRIDFVHRTFQEYLTAREAAEHGDVGLLLHHAHQENWRETIIMAAGHANEPTRKALLAGLLGRASSEPRHSRTLRLLAAACLETAGPLDTELRSQVEACLSDLVPPRRSEEARSLASAGPALLVHAPRGLNPYSTEAASAMIEAVALLGTPQALDLLSFYAIEHSKIREDSDRERNRNQANRHLDAIQRKLFEMNRYFDGRRYSRAVLCHLRNIPHLELDNVTNLADDLRSLPPIKRMRLRGKLSDLKPIVSHIGPLEELTVQSESSIDVRSIANLPGLQFLTIECGDAVNLLPLHTLSLLRVLDLNCSEILSLNTLIEMGSLHTVRIRNSHPTCDLSILADGKISVLVTHQDMWIRWRDELPGNLSLWRPDS
ncbi:NACHT domain-containing protein [Actinokineospora sp. NBRC 105648]|uniref:NACHT domain-containing protein n=1 Tax=Actinokineospora sp. NBRC 105648 TaxID=3032206 RepID=UPI002554A2CF|nr:NACHT domain-containing protein [Actinokineospora sp. NBRC 105648]